MGKEYLVEGAKLMCVNGGSFCELKIPKGHGYTSGGRKKANCKDCKACTNIPYFGTCKKNEKTHMCEGFMKLEDKWESMDVSLVKAEKVDQEDAITMDSVLLCKQGGIILPLTSGQGYEEGIDWAAFTKRFMKVMDWAAGKNLLCHVFGADPINMNTGNFVYEKEELSIGGITPLSFHIFYNAMKEETGGSLGEGWHHNYELYVREGENGKRIRLCLGDGREIPYRLAMGGIYVPEFGDRGLLKKEKQGFLYCAADKTEYKFGPEGWLLTRRDKNGNTDFFTHNKQGQLLKVSGANGGELFYTYNKEGNLIRVKDHTGREVQIWYRYGKLWKLVNALGYAYTYDYNVNGKLESVLTPRGIIGIKNEYDAADRVVKQEMPDGSAVFLRYDDLNLRTYMKEQNGTMVIYENDERCRNIRTVYEDGEEIFEYNDKNQKTLCIDKNGNRTRYRYDKNGNLIEIENALGQKMIFSYDEKNNLLECKMPDGSVRQNTYDQQGNLIKRINPLGNMTEVSYNERQQPIKMIREDGSCVELRYDKRGNIESIRDAMGSQTGYEYDELNRVTAATDGNGNRFRYSYNERNDVISVMNPMGDVRKYEYNPSGKVTSITDYDGSVQKMWYDSCNRPKCCEDADGNVTEFTYDPMGNPICEKMPNGGEIRLTYDHYNRLIQYIDAVGGTTKFVYDACGNRIKTEDQRGGITTCSYDALNRITEKKDPDGMITWYEYDTSGNTACIKDSLGNEIRMEYDACGRKIKETDARGRETSFCYNSLGKPVQITDSAGRVMSYEYYSGGLLKKTVFWDGSSESYAYDGNRNMIEKWNESGYRIFYEYDAQNRVVSIKSNDNQEMFYTYDAVGNVIAKKDANGSTVKYRYTSSGKLMEAEDAAGGVTKYGYDSLGCLTAVFRTGSQEERQISLDDAVRINESRHNLHLMLYERDLQGQVVSVTNPLGHKEEYEYDAAGNIIRKKDRDGYQTLFSYDVKGQLEKINYEDGRIAEYTYDPLGQLKEIKDWLGTTTAEYDSYGRIHKVTDHRGKSVIYELGDRDERRAVIYPDGSRVDYDYDSLLRLQEVRSGKSRIQYAYGTDGRLAEKKCGNGITTSYCYDRAGRLTELTHKDPKEVLEDYRYMYDPAENLTGVIKYRKGIPEESGDYRYGYDPLGRLTHVEKDNKLLREYEYDPFSNRSSMSEEQEKTIYSYNSADQLLRKSGKTETFYHYDLRGNLTQISQNGMAEKQFVYDTAGQLSMFEGAGQRGCRYLYNGLRNRVSMIETEDEAEHLHTEYFWDMTKGNSNLLMMESEETCQHYLWGRHLEGMSQDGLDSYALLDELGSPVRFLWYNGNEMYRYSYDEFGRDLYQTESVKQPFTYTGYLKDRISGTYFAQAREYLPEDGRFGGEDIRKGYLEQVLTLNSYTYCWNSPLIYVDLTGEETDKEWYLTLFEQGNDAHQTLKLYSMDAPNLVPEAYIPSGLEKGNGSGYSTKSGTGRADYIYYNYIAKRVEVYELKPDTVSGREKGSKQLAAYINAINNNKNNDFRGWKAERGRTLNSIFNCSHPSIKYKDKTIYYHTDPTTPGMIYWSYEKPQEKRKSVPYEVPEKNKFVVPKWAKNTGYVIGGSFISFVAFVLLADDVAGGFADDGLALSFIAIASEFFNKVSTNCSNVY